MIDEENLDYDDDPIFDMQQVYELIEHEEWYNEDIYFGAEYAI